MQCNKIQHNISAQLLLKLQVMEVKQVASSEFAILCGMDLTDV